MVIKGPLYDYTPVSVLPHVEGLISPKGELFISKSENYNDSVTDLDAIGNGFGYCGGSKVSGLTLAGPFISIKNVNYGVQVRFSYNFSKSYMRVFDPTTLKWGEWNQYQIL